MTTNNGQAEAAEQPLPGQYRTIAVGMEGAMDEVDLNNLSAVARISIASSEQIYQWCRRKRQSEKYGFSRAALETEEQDDLAIGEVKKPETINYRTFKPEKDGLFCERIFGPQKDWECSCGKYKRIKYKGIICDRCGVEVTESRVRRVRMGYIKLAAPVCHIWFYKGTSSKISNILDISVRDVGKVIYFQEYIIVDAHPDTGLKPKEVIPEDVARKYQQQYGEQVKIGIGAEAIQELLRQIDVEDLANQLQVEMREVSSAQKRNKIIKRLKVVEAFRGSPNKPEFMIIDVLPVIPPDLRPLVHLDGGRFATSDLNDLYRRVINRNNRLKRLVELRAPDVILRNEKRMLQEAVDALFDNSRRSRPTKGHNNRPLKSLSDMLKGKQGRFRQNLLGKRVDYSGRSVIVVGPDLGFNQCGLPKKMALELFEPFIIRELERRSLATTIKSAKKMIEKGEEVVYDILEEVIKDHPVLLNRAPTLHRLGIQAFMPKLVEGKAIRLHPLSCAAFNADFDGDQMAVHVPLSIEARLEAKLLMLAENNIIKPADGRPVATPSQDIILGCFYLTKLKHGNVKGEYRELRRTADGKIHELDRPTAQELRNKLGNDAFNKQYRLVGKRGCYSSPDEAQTAHEHGELDLQAEIQVRIRNYRGSGEDRVFFTSVGRLKFADILPKDKLDYMDLANEVMTKKALGQVVSIVFETCGNQICARVLDDIKNLGFRYAKRGGLSICIKDMVIPARKAEIIEDARVRTERILNDFNAGDLTDQERYNNIVNTWTHATDEVSKELMDTLAKHQNGFNPVYIMSFSGARGNKDQIRQLAGMRGLMQRPTKKLTGSVGEIIEQPIRSNFREGLTVLEYFISTHGARKGLADTALKTADAGYLTRRLCDVAQDLIVNEDDCGTHNGLTVRAITEVDARGERIIVPLRDRITGRTPVEDVVHPKTGALIVGRGMEVTEAIARDIEEAGIQELEIRTVLTCQTRRGICRRCYGRNLATGRMVDLGEAVGIIAAQSIGEPGTQLTLRTFHTGGVSMGLVEGYYQSEIEGSIKYKNLQFLETGEGELVVTNRLGSIKVLDRDGNEAQTLPNIPYGAKLLKRDGQNVRKGERIVTWDPSNTPIIAEHDGKLRWKDIIDGITLREDADTESETQILTITEAKEDRHPKLEIIGEDGKVLADYSLAAGTILARDLGDGADVKRGQLLARVARSQARSRDITGGLPRVDELFEARKPKEAAFIADISGTLRVSTAAKGLRTCHIVADNGEEHKYLIPMNRNFFIRDGERVNVGDVITDGAISPHDVLRVKGEKSVMQFLMTEIQDVYRLQGVAISDKHIEAIVRQMLKKVVIEEPGNTRFLFGQQVDKWLFQEENDRVIREGGQPAVGKPKLLGLTKASLETESFISAASFQETTRVLTDAAIRGRKDYLRGLKENVIMGLLIPAGTGLSRYRSLVVSSASEAARAAAEEQAAADA